MTNTNGETIPPVETIVKDSDIMACNDEQYTFFVKRLSYKLLFLKIGNNEQTQFFFI